MTDPHIARLRIYPIKALDSADVDAATITEAGTLAGDRRYAMLAGRELLNGKATDAVHRLDATFPDPPHVVELDDGDRVQQFDLRTERDEAEAFLTEYFRSEADVTAPVELREAKTGFSDRPGTGPSVVSTATLEAVSRWFDDVSVPELRRRLRANIEVAAVPPFWEDRFVSDGPDGFEAGGVRIEGVEACVRCVVPERDSKTGERDFTFRERFLERRRETLPEWIDEDDFESLYSLMLIAQVPETNRTETLSVGDRVDDGS